MPYISQTSRDKFEEILKKVSELGELPSGELNYLITSIIVRQYKDIEEYKDNLYNINYEKINQIMGVLECVKEEFYRRIASPYEHIKLRQSGDVY